MAGPVAEQTIRVEINGEVYEQEVEARKLLVHFIRDVLDLTGTHVGCDTGNCGACTVLVDGKTVKSCMLLAIQADGATITTVEGLAGPRDLPPRAEPAPFGGGDPPRHPGQHLPLHGLREHRGSDPFRRREPV